MVRPVHVFNVVPSLPPQLKRLSELAHNLFWAWDHETIDLFRRLDRDLWEEAERNPVRMLGSIRQECLEAATTDDGFLAHFRRVCERFDLYMSSQNGWYTKTYGPSDKPLIAYFSAEFGVADCIPNYSGGLGVLAGDVLKSASDLNLPLVGVGLLYQEGYFRQYLNPDGWQQESYPINDFHNMPLRLEHHPDGTPVTISVPYPGRDVIAQVWRAQVGRVPLYLLDTNLEANRPEDQDITDQLYGGDLETRIQQEIMLGIGGLRALAALGIEPAICHANEGHSAFLALERIRMLMEKYALSFAEAKEIAIAGNVFTTHTPVSAGIDVFPPYLIDKYFTSYYQSLGISREEFLALGRVNPRNTEEAFSMAVLALRLAGRSNAVSKLHGTVARKMWRDIWPGVPEDEIPIISITNGIHPKSWVSGDMSGLYDRYLGPNWARDAGNGEIWRRVDRIPDEELWRTHERRRERLVAFARRRLRAQLERQGAPPSALEEADEALNPSALTIVFARRFATYKRATLLFHNPERLAAIISNPRYPVQIIYAGKAHPRDNPGKEMIRQIIHQARREEFKGRIVFLEDYDMNVARYLLQGADVWLNTPRRLLEASGTSGMKAAINGALNLSILDGWWDEAYRPDVGWSIGQGEVYEDHQYQDEVESSAIYNLLEQEIIPLFYDRGATGVPRGWVAKMKMALKTICPVFNTHRVVRDYTEKLYLPGIQLYHRLTENEMSRAKTLAAWRLALLEHWEGIKIEKVEVDTAEEIRVGDQITARAIIRLPGLQPTDIRVQLYHGPLDVKGQITKGTAVDMVCQGPQDENSYLFVGTIPCRSSGRHGFAVRILPYHEDLITPFQPGLIVWSTEE